MCTCVHARVCLLVYAHMEARGNIRVFLFAFHLIFETRFLTDEPGWLASESLELPCVHFSEPGYIHDTTVDFCEGVRDLNPGPHASVVHTMFTEPSLKPHLFSKKRPEGRKCTAR